VSGFPLLTNILTYLQKYASKTQQVPVAANASCVSCKPVFLKLDRVFTSLI